MTNLSQSAEGNRAHPRSYSSGADHPVSKSVTQAPSKRHKKDCMFQYIVTHGNILSTYENIEDTGLITYDEAKALFEKHKASFIKNLEDEYSSPEMAIWINSKDNTDYHTAKPHLNNETKRDGRRFYNNVREYIEL